MPAGARGDGAMGLRPTYQDRFTTHSKEAPDVACALHTKQYGAMAHRVRAQHAPQAARCAAVRQWHQGMEGRRGAKEASIPLADGVGTDALAPAPTPTPACVPAARAPPHATRSTRAPQNLGGSGRRSVVASRSRFYLCVNAQVALGTLGARASGPGRPTDRDEGTASSPHARVNSPTNF